MFLPSSPSRIPKRKSRVQGNRGPSGHDHVALNHIENLENTAPEPEP